MEALKQEETEQPAALELVGGYRDEEDEGVSEGGPWRIGDLASLDWALRRLGALEQEISDNEDVLHQRIQEMELRCARLNEKAMRGVRFFRAQIAAYAQAHRKELLGGGAKRSRSLLHGTVGWRTHPARLEVTDEKALLEWAQAQPVELGLVRMEEKLCVRDIQKHAQKSQQVPPGMAQKPASEELQIRVDLKEVL